MIKNILVPLSGSDTDAAVFATALALVRSSGGHLRPRAALDLGADLLVVRAFGHGQFREEVFGGVTQSLLESTNLPVSMMH
jgi:hypothetical protein